MPATLRISIEGTWRDLLLDTVIPIAEFSLTAHDSIPGLKSLSDEQKINLTSGEPAFAWCAITPSNEVKFSITHKERMLISLSTIGEFNVELLLPDGKSYQFRLINYDC